MARGSSVSASHTGPHYTSKSDPQQTEFEPIVCLYALSLLPSERARAEKFKKDDPIQEDLDNLFIPPPTDRPLSKTVDLLQKTFTSPEGGTLHAQNVNNFGGGSQLFLVRDRMSLRVMSVDELLRGPNRSSGPDMSGRFIVNSPLPIIRNHKDDIAAMDLFTVPTASLRLLYSFFVIEHGRRHIVHFNATFHPTSAWVMQQLREAFPYDTAPHADHVRIQLDTEAAAFSPTSRFSRKRL